MKHYHTLGPVPVMMLADIIKQCEEQGWTVRFVAFGGHVAVQQSVIQSAAQQNVPTMPGFALVIDKELPEGTLAILPKLTGGFK